MAPNLSPIAPSPSPVTPGFGTKVNYLPSSTHIFGIAVVNDATSVPERPRTVLLKAAFWTGGEPMLGLFRYFNTAPGISFERNQRFFIHSTVSSTLISCFLRLTNCQVAQFNRKAVLTSSAKPSNRCEALWCLWRSIATDIPPLSTARSQKPQRLLTASQRPLHCYAVVLDYF